MTSVLGSRFWRLWSAFTTSNLGDGLTLVGFPLLAIGLTDDARLVALVAAFRVLPFVTIGLPAGVVIDRVDRRHLALVAQLARASALIAIAVAVARGSATIPIVAGVAFVVGMGEVLTDGGLPAVVRDVVASSDLEVANSRLRASETVSNAFIGPPVGAFLFQLDPSAPFFAAAGLYVVTAGVLAILEGSYKPEADPDRGSFGTQMTAGLKYVWNHPVLRPLALTVAAFAFVGEAGNAIFVILATERFGLSEFQYGLLLSVDALASVTMSFFVLTLVNKTSHGTSMKVSVVAFSVQAFLFGFSTFVPLAVVAVLFGGISDPTWNVISGTVRQRLVDDQIFGRMMTAYLFIAWSIQPLGAVVGGLVAQAWGPQWVYVLSGTVVGSLLFVARPLFRRIDQAMAAATTG
ncbi:MAG: MFS transporter [Acidimicrobiales bacterium]|nr:MFS transporter [Acidimicrobiales bacterium]